MAEQKKRWRPSLTAYRELEAKNAELSAMLEEQIKSYKTLEKKYQEEFKKNLEGRTFWQRIFNR